MRTTWRRTASSCNEFAIAKFLDVLLSAANILSFADWLVVYCSEQQPKQANGDFFATGVSPSTTYEETDAPQSYALYGNIDRAPRIDDLNANTISIATKNEYEDPGTVIHSEP